MVLDSRSRVEDAEVLNGKGTKSTTHFANSSSDGSSNDNYPNIEIITPNASIPIALRSNQNPIARWWEKLGLRAKTTIIAVSAITIPLLLVGGFTSIYVGQNLAQTTKQKEAKDAADMSYRIAYFMRERYGDIQILSRISFLVNPKVTAVTSLQERQSVLNDYIKTSIVYDSIAAFDLNGDVIVQSQGDPLSNHKDRVYFQEVLKTNAPLISQPDISKSSGKVVIHIAAPIKDATTGKTIGVIRARMPVEYLDDLVKDFAVGGEEYYLAESDGKFFAAVEKEQIGRDFKVDFPLLTPLAEKRESGSATLIDRVTKREQFVGYAPLQKLEGLPDLKWDMVITADTDIVLKPQQQLIFILLAATGVVGALAAILAITIAKRATKPVIEATAAVVELGKGNLDTRLMVQGQDELAQLGDNINSMAGQLQTFLSLQEVQARRSQILAEVSRSRDIAELEEPLSRYVAEIRQEINSDRLVIYRFVNTGTASQGIIVAESGLTHLPSAKNAGLNDPCIPQELLDNYRQGKVMQYRDVLNAGLSPAHLELMRTLQIKSNLIVPVVRAGELDSFLIAHSCGQVREWQEPEIKLMQSYAEEIGRALGGLATLEQQRIVAEQERTRSEAIQRELINLLTEVEGAVSGDLTVRAQISAGEIGIVADFFNAIVENLREVVTQVKEATLQVNTSVNTNNASIRTLAKDATLQAEQLDEALKSVEQMTDSIQQVASNARQAADASNVAATTAETGSQAIEQSAVSILQLRQTVAETAKKVKRLGEASQQISKVVVLIDQIALKTNMLAVNASIEAARAGEEGRGFAVVAEEVGALAAQSATATKEIARIVESIQQETSEVVESIEASTVQVVEGTNKVEDARKSLNQIVEVARKVNELFQGISSATISQVQTSQSVKQVMETLSTQSQRSSETSREVSIALQETADVASKLQASVETFKVDAA
ncbi:MAG: methyl-accepting chemotaxis protein [Pseudanabaena sp.]